MQPVLGTLIVDTTDSDPDRSHDYSVALLVSISLEEHRELMVARDALLTLQRNSQLYRLAQWNYWDYYSALSRYLIAYIDQDSDYLSSFPIRLGINRCLLNLLSSIRTFLDHTQTSLARRYGDTSQNLINFKRYLSEAYDGHFSYRFLYKLRDYSQHCGLPIDNIVFSTRLNPLDAGKPFCCLEASINRDRLFTNFNWKRLKLELLQQPSMIDINYHIDAVMNLIEGINAKVIADELPLLTQKANLIKDFAGKVFSHREYREGAPYLFELLNEGGKIRLDQSMNLVPIPVDIALAVLDGDAEQIV